LALAGLTESSRIKAIGTVSVSILSQTERSVHQPVPLQEGRKPRYLFRKNLSSEIFLILIAISVLPPVLVPRHSEFAPGHSLLPFQQLTEPAMPHNVSYSATGFNNSHSHLSPQSAGPNSPISNVNSPATQTTNPQSPFSSNGMPGKEDCRKSIES